MTSHAHTPIRARRGRVVHLTSVDSSSARYTLCGLPCDGWAIAAFATCRRCLACVA